MDDRESFKQDACGGEKCRMGLRHANAGGYCGNGGYPHCMPEQRIKDLELQLATANASIATLTATNLELTRDLSGAESRNKKLKRSARQDETAFKEQLSVAQNRRG
jgi:hypothetical protein